MIQEDVLGLLPGSMFGAGSAAESRMPRETFPGGGTTVSPSGDIGAINRTAGGAGEYGTKMPLSKIPSTEQKITEARGKTEAEGDYFGLPLRVWHDIGVYGLLLILFLIGVVMLLSAAGIQTPVQKVLK